MNLARSSLLIFLSRMIKAIAGFAAVVVFSRELGASPLGTYYPFVALIGLISIPADFGIITAVQKRISEGQDGDIYLGSAIVIKIPILLSFITLLWMSRSYINHFLGTNLTLLLIVTLVVNQISSLSLGVLRGELRVGETAIIQVLRPLSWLIVGYLFYIQGYGVYSLAYAYLIGTVLMAMVGWWKVSTSVNLPSIDHIRSLFDYSQYSVISSLGGYFYNWMDVAILTAFVTAGITSSRAEIGAYENAWRVSLIIMIITQSISVSLFPQISKWDADDATGQIESIIPIALIPGTLLIIPGFVGTMILSSDILEILFGEEFTVAWLVLIILSGEKLFQSVHSIFGNVLQGMDRPDLAAYSTVAAASVNLILNVTLIWIFGIIGAALATTTASAVRAIIQTKYIEQFLEIEYPTRIIIGSGFASILMGICLYTIRISIKIVSGVQLVGVIGFGIAIYTAVVLMFTSVREMLRQTVLPAMPWIPVKFK